VSGTLTEVINSDRIAGGIFCLPHFVVISAIFIALQVIPVVGILAESLEDVLARSNYSASKKEAVFQLFREAREDKIPGDLLLPRLVEGVAKRVPADKVLSVLRQNLINLREARSILLGVSDGVVLLENRSSWLRTANLLAGGVPAEEIREIAEACRLRWGDYRQATYLYVSLANWGLDRKNSLDLVRAFLKSSIPGESFAGVLELLVAGRRLRISPEELIRRIKDELPRVETLEELHERILYE